MLISYGWLQHKKTKVRKEVKRQLLAGKADDELVLLKFSLEASKTELRWEHSREFEYQGQMYDIVRTEQRGDSVIYHCCWDREETQLNAAIKTLVSRILHKDVEHNSQQERLFSFLKSLYHAGMSEWHLPCLAECVSGFPANPVVFPPHPTLSPPIPPPEMV